MKDAPGEVVLTADEAEAVREWLKARRQYVVEEMHGEPEDETERRLGLTEERVAYLLTRLIVETRWS
jgi:hypothetical protein